MSKVVVVTGGLSGIGLAITTSLLENDFVVYSTYINKTDEEVDKIKCDLNSDNLYPIMLDITSNKDCATVISNILSKHSQIYALINNAGITDDSSFKRMSYIQWERVLNVNLLSIFNTTQPVFNNMMENKQGRVINISSVNAIKGQFGQCNYSASKAGIIAFSKSLALEGARNNVLVNVVAPGYVDTKMMSSIPDEILEKIKATVPLGRLITPLEIASTILFLLSEHSSAITGETISVNGGLIMN